MAIGEVRPTVPNYINVLIRRPACKVKLNFIHIIEEEYIRDAR